MAASDACSDALAAYSEVFAAVCEDMRAFLDGLDDPRVLILVDGDNVADEFPHLAALASGDAGVAVIATGTALRPAECLAALGAFGDRGALFDVAGSGGAKETPRDAADVALAWAAGQAAARWPAAGILIVSKDKAFEPLEDALRVWLGAAVALLRRRYAPRVLPAHIAPEGAPDRVAPSRVAPDYLAPVDLRPAALTLFDLSEMGLVDRPALWDAPPGAPAVKRWPYVRMIVSALAGAGTQARARVAVGVLLSQPREIVPCPRCTNAGRPGHKVRRTGPHGEYFGCSLFFRAGCRWTGKMLAGPEGGRAASPGESTAAPEGGPSV